MVRTNVPCQLGMGLMLSLAAAFAGSGARADAETESPFFLYPPAGWAREVSQDGTVTYYDPETPNYCAIRIAPVIPKILR